MPSFVSPHPRYQQSFLACVQEIRDAGEDDHWTGLTIFGEETHTVDELADPAGFAAFAQRLHDLALPETPRPESKVAETTLWWVDGDSYLGRLSIRHRLTCHASNAGSRRVIESGGGVLEDQREDKLRFWVPTSS